MISQTAEYALRAAVVLGSQPDRPMTTQEIAQASLVPVGYLAKVLQLLGKAGIVEARRGIRGGHILNRSLERLTVYDVVNAVDPLERITHCPLKLSAHAERLCSLHQKLDDAVAMLEAYFKQTTIRDLLNDRTAPLPGPLCNVHALASLNPAAPAEDPTKSSSS